MAWREGIDENPVVPNRPTQSPKIPLSRTSCWRKQSPQYGGSLRRHGPHRRRSRVARTVVLKLKTADFNVVTRSHTPNSPPASCDEVTRIALSLLQKVNLGMERKFRLVGVGLSNFKGPNEETEHPALFE